MRLVVARCQVHYRGRLTSFLAEAKRLLILKADGSVSIHADGGAYKPLNWMSPPCFFQEKQCDADTMQWLVTSKTGDELEITIRDVELDTSISMGPDPGLIKDGVEAHLQKLLAEQPQILTPDCQLITREYMTAIGPVDLLCRDNQGVIAVEIKRRGEIDGVEQLTRYLELLNRDPLLAPVRGIFAAQSIKLQAKTLAQDRGIECVTLDYEALKGLDDGFLRLF